MSIIIGTLITPKEAVAEQVSQKDITCITTALYHEARGESEKGQLAVANVILNRLHNDKFKAKTACGVVYQPRQFSWTRWTKTAPQNEQYDSLKNVALKAVNMYYNGQRLPCHNATFFTTGRFSFKGIKYECKIGSHSFYSLL